MYWHQICRCIGRMHDAIVRGHGHFVTIIDNPSRLLSRPVVDQSLPNTGQRIVIVCCPSFPWHKGARRETVAIDPQEGFPEDELFVSSSFLAATWQRGPHFSGWPLPAIALSFSICSPSFSFYLSHFLSFSKRKKKRICIMPSCDFLASFACARDQLVRARIGLTMSTACWCCFRFRSS